MTTTKTNAREQLIAFVLDHGWELDPNRTIWARPRVTSDRERIQDPHAFRHPAANGNFWSLQLDYQRRDRYQGETDNRLRGATIQLVNAEGKILGIGEHSYHNHIRLDAQTDGYYGSTLAYHFWAVTTRQDAAVTTLRDRVQTFAVNPDLVAWLAEESRVQREVRLAEQKRQRERELKARRQPLKITVPQQDWEVLTDRLRRAAVTLDGAHGLTDLPATVAQAEQALAAIKAVLAPADAEALS